MFSQNLAKLSEKRHVLIVLFCFANGESTLLNFQAGVRVQKRGLTRMATLPSAIPVTVDIVEFGTLSDSRKTSTVTRMASLPSAIPVTVDIVEFGTLSDSRKTSTVTRMASLPSAILVTVDIFEFRTPSKSRKTSTVTRMATLTPAIPVTVDTFHIQESKNDDSYKETRGRGRANPSKKKGGANPLKKKTLHRIWGISYYNIPKAIFSLLKGDYTWRGTGLQGLEVWIYNCGAWDPAPQFFSHYTVHGGNLAPP